MSEFSKEKTSLSFPLQSTRQGSVKLSVGEISAEMRSTSLAIKW